VLVACRSSIFVANNKTISVGDKTLKAGFLSCWGNLVLYILIFIYDF